MSRFTVSSESESVFAELDTIDTMDVLEQSNAAYQHLLDCHSIALHLMVERGLLGEYAHRLYEVDIQLPPRS